MVVGILYNIFICLVISAVGFAVFRRFRKIRKEKKITYSEGIDYFTLLLGTMWFFIGLRNFFNGINRSDLNILVFYWVSGPLVYLHLLPAFYYFGWNIIKNKKMRIFFDIFFTLVVLAAVFTFYTYKFTEGEVTYWGSNHEPNDLTNLIFVYCIFLPAFVFIIISILKNYKDWRKTGDSAKKQLTGFSVGFLIYALTGVIDAMGGVKDWVMLLSRIGIMLAPLTFYIVSVWSIED